MIKPGSSLAGLIGRWGTGATVVIAGVLLGRVIRDMPYLLPNRLPGLMLYEMGPGLILTLAVGAAVRMTQGRDEQTYKLIAFTLIAVLVGTAVLGATFAASLGGQWI